MRGALINRIRQLERKTGLEQRPFDTLIKMESSQLLALIKQLEDQLSLRDQWPIVTWRSHTARGSGYDRASRAYVFGLSKAGVLVRPVFRPELHQPSLTDEDKLLVEWERARPLREVVAVHYGIPVLWGDEGTYKIGFTVYETSICPRHWVPIINQKMDEVWTASHFCKLAFENAGVKVPIYVFPHCLDLARWQPTPNERSLDGTFKFFALGDLRGRKGWDCFMRAYLEEFSQKEPVEAIFKAYASEEEAWQRIRGLGISGPEGDWPPLRVSSGWIPSMPSFLRGVDAVVMASRGEGYGLLGLEGMACGCAVVSTAFGGQLEYLTEDNSYLVDFRLSRPIDMDDFDDYRQYHGEMVACDVDIEDLRRQMRRCYENEEERERKIRRGLEDVKKFSDVEVCGRIQERLMEIGDGLRK